ncbi:hypothetical protein TeGR_g9293 [Tetraparma gracilis]|uniref:Uncharacterized protein n=1 Tax=Tetraparma gracilis TaxID=2962635 RepID=A0ABQ6N4B3_9STRA|nr:hypothetical protein TeGR_g9293 [Tetraparma gracilis]
MSLSSLNLFARRTAQSSKALLARPISNLAKPTPLVSSARITSQMVMSAPYSASPLALDLHKVSKLRKRAG